MYSQAPNDIPSGYSGSAFRSKTFDEDPTEATPDESVETAALPSSSPRRKSLLSFLDRFRVGRYLKGFDLEDFLILALALLLLLEDGEDDLFPLLLLFLFIQ